MKGFKRTRHPNLLRHEASGNYYVRARTGEGREVARSLETSVLSVARVKMPRVLAAILAAAGRLRGGNLTLGECAAVYLDRLQTRGRKSRSLDYRRETVEMIRRMWPEFDKRPAALVTKSECLAWADRGRRKYSGTRFNGMVESLRGILEIAVEAGAVDSNAARFVERARVKPAVRFIPSRDEFTRILAKLDALTSRRHAALAVRALAFTGLRPVEARNLTAADIDLAKRTLTARVTKNGYPRTIQLTAQAWQLFADDLPGTLAALRRSPKKALGSVSRELGLPHISPYTFRHLHLTRLVESGLDIITVAETAGHRDRGRTLLGSYTHARPEHVREQIRKVTI